MRLIKLNRLYALLLRFPTKNWNWTVITRSTDITIEIIERHPNFPWVWSEVCYKQDITREFLNKYKGRIELAALASSNFTWEDVEDHLDNMTEDDLSYIWANKRLDFDYILKSEKLKAAIDHGQVSSNWLTPWRDVVRTKDIIKWDYDEVIRGLGTTIPLEDVISGKYGVHWWAVSDKECITLEFVEAHLEYDWDWAALMQQRWFTPAIFEKYKDKIAKYEYAYYLIYNKNFSIEYLEKAAILPDIMAEYSHPRSFNETYINRFSFDELKKYKVPLEQAVNNRKVPISFCKRQTHAEMKKKGKESSFPSWTKGFNCSLARKIMMDSNMCKRGDITLLDIIENKTRVDWYVLSGNQFDRKRRAYKVILRLWHTYRTRKNQRKMMEKVTKEISILPSCYVSSAFPGGEEYRNAMMRFAALSL